MDQQINKQEQNYTLRVEMEDALDYSLLIVSNGS